MTDAQLIAKMVELLNGYPALQKKAENMRKAMLKAQFERTFWHRKCRYYAPNKMEEHYAELDEELKKAGLYVE